jgi:hypothetical protein
VRRDHNYAHTFGNVILENFYLYHIEVVEHACGMGTLQMGEYVSNVSNGVDTYSVREPTGVCAGICPFNFPAMIPLWVRNLLFFLWAFGYSIDILPFISYLLLSHPYYQHV